jgi:hypothetical protein
LTGSARGPAGGAAKTEEPKPMSTQATIQSRCECQATLSASLNSERHVLGGWATEPRRGRREGCPAHSIGADAEQFQVGWLCPFCGRNTMRVFYAGALTWRSASMSERPPARPPR